MIEGRRLRKSEYYDDIDLLGISGCISHVGGYEVISITIDYRSFSSSKACKYNNQYAIFASIFLKEKLGSIVSIVASAILLHGFNTDNPTNVASLIYGFVIILLAFIYWIQLLEVYHIRVYLLKTKNKHY
ncbi:hypothetical protein EDC94DRAFT_581828 [Helicostylum pulchrum]|nr:hypothetical protein EDC94DRAFT_581828 [Helicostylum pulchrum]